MNLKFVYIFIFLLSIVGRCIGQPDREKAVCAANTILLNIYFEGKEYDTDKETNSKTEILDVFRTAIKDSSFATITELQSELVAHGFDDVYEAHVEPINKLINESFNSVEELYVLIYGIKRANFARYLKKFEGKEDLVRENDLLISKYSNLPLRSQMADDLESVTQRLSALENLPKPVRPAKTTPSWILISAISLVLVLLILLAMHVKKLGDRIENLKMVVKERMENRKADLSSHRNEMINMLKSEVSNAQFRQENNTKQQTQDKLNLSLSHEVSKERAAVSETIKKKTGKIIHLPYPSQPLKFMVAYEESSFQAGKTCYVFTEQDSEAGKYSFEFCQDTSTMADALAQVGMYVRSACDDHGQDPSGKTIIHTEVPGNAIKRGEFYEVVERATVEYK